MSVTGPPRYSDKQIDRQTDQTDRKIYIQTNRQIDRQTERQIDRLIGRFFYAKNTQRMNSWKELPVFDLLKEESTNIVYLSKQIDRQTIQTDRKIKRQTGRQIKRQKDRQIRQIRQIDRQTDKTYQPDRQIDRQTDKTYQTDRIESLTNK